MDSLLSAAFNVMLHSYYESASGLIILAVHDYMKVQGIDPELVLAHAGVASGFHCSFDQAGFFHFDPDGQQCLVFEVLGEDAATAIDLCAVSVADPNCFGTAMGNAPVLGLTNVTNPASWALGKLLPVFRHPLNWLRAGCQGVVILHHRGAPDCLARKLGNLLAEDEAHARDLRSMLCSPPIDPSSILFPRSATRRTAA